MSVNDELGTRMKTFYEQIPKTRLMRRTPVAIRIDGKAFHTFTRGFQKPFDKVLMTTMQETTKYLCENIQGCVFGYTQSDEITLILIDYKELNTSAWFDYEVQKLCSISASMATMAFNKYFSENVDKYNSDPKSSGVQANWYLAVRVATYAFEKALVTKEIKPEEAYAVGLAHDLIEDIDCTPDELLEVIDSYLVGDILTLTKADEEEYGQYIMNIVETGSDLAKLVKGADMKDHMMQYDTLTDKLWSKYKPYLGYFL